MEKLTVTFDKDLKKEILSVFNKDVDEDGFIVEKADPFQRVISPNGEEVRIDELAGVAKGSEIFVKSDLVSLIDFSKREK